MALAAAVLAENDPATAERMVADGLITNTRAGTVARVTLSESDENWVSVSVVGELQPPDPTLVPSARLVRAHPLHAYHAETGDLAPAHMRDVMRAGWTIGAAGREAMKALRLSEEQVSLVVSPVGAAWDGWVLVGERSLGRRDVEQLRAVRPLLVGLARHCRVLRLAAERLPDCQDVRLTPRERVVLCLMVQGRTAEGIAARLAISPRTVHKHQEHLYRKLGAVDRLSAVLAAQRRGLLAVR